MPRRAWSSGRPRWTRRRSLMALFGPPSSGEVVLGSGTLPRVSQVNSSLRWRRPRNKARHLRSSRWVYPVSYTHLTLPTTPYV